jgi:hypothetical protein
VVSYEEYPLVGGIGERHDLIAVALHDERQYGDRQSAPIARFIVAWGASAARQFSLGSLAFLGHA